MLNKEAVHLDSLFVWDGPKSVQGAVLSLKSKTAEHAEVEVPQRIRFELGPWGRFIPEAVGHASTNVEGPEAEAKTPADLSEQGQG